MDFLTRKDLDINQLDDLWTAIGWASRGKKKWKEVLSKSSFVCSVWDKKNMIGFGRILEDGMMCMFYDIGVHPEFRERGIGTKLVKILINQVKDKGYASIGLFAWEQNPNNILFYKKFGFKQVPTGMELVKHMKRE